MHIESLVRMANDIGAFFASEPQADQAAKAVLAHIKRYWDPRMRAQIAAHYRSNGGEGMAPHVSAAIAQLAADSPATEKKA